MSPSSWPLAGLLGEGAIYRGDLSFEGRVRVDGTFIGKINSNDFVEIGPTGRVVGELLAAQVLVAGTVDGVLQARERCTLLESARVSGKVITPWLDVRIGCRLSAEVKVEREEG